MISYDFMWCSCISFLSFAFFLPFWPGLTVGRFGCEPFCRTQSALLQGPAPGQGPNRSPFAGPLQQCCLEALSQDQPFGQPFLKTFSPQALAAGSRCWPGTPLPPSASWLLPALIFRCSLWCRLGLWPEPVVLLAALCLSSRVVTKPI